MSTVKDRILWLIEHFEGGTKKKLADKIGIPTGQLNNYIKDKPSKPKDDLQEKICNAYGVTKAWLNGFEPLMATEEIVKPKLEPHTENYDNDKILPLSRDALLLELGRAQGETRALRSALKESNHTLRDHVDRNGEKTEESLDKIDKRFDRLIDVLTQTNTKKEPAQHPSHQARQHTDTPKEVQQRKSKDTGQHSKVRVHSELHH